MKDNNSDILNLLSVTISVSALLLIILSTVFNIYSYNVSKEERSILTDKNIIIDYESSNKVELSNITPGTSLEYVFTISSKESATSISNYEIYFDVEKNNLPSESFYYKIAGESDRGSESGTLIKEEFKNFVDYSTPHFSGSIKPGETQKYKLSLSYTTNASNKKNNLIGTIKVDTVIGNEEK